MGRLMEIDIDDIVVVDRARTDYTIADSLAKSIEENGMLHALVVVDLGNGKYRLACGGTRMAALKRLMADPDKQISRLVPCNVYPIGTTDLQILRMELAENKDRANMTFVEELRLTQKIHDNLAAINREHNPAEDWTQAQTAVVLGKSRQSVTADLQLLRAVEQMPELATAKNAAEAKKLYDKAQEQRILAELTKRAEASKQRVDVKSRVRDLVERYIVGDTLEMLSKLQDESIDLVSLDPPYGVDLHENKAVGDTGSMANYNEVLAKDYPEFISRVLAECWRVMKRDSWMILWFGSDPWFGFLLDKLRSLGFKLRGTPGIWLKEGSGGQTNQPELLLASRYEMFFYVRKGEPKIRKPGTGNVFPCKVVPVDNKIHPTEKPIDLMTTLYSLFADPGAIVLSPFLGSGNDILAADELHMKCVGYDLSKEYRNAFAARVAFMHADELVAQMQMGGNGNDQEAGSA